MWESELKAGKYCYPVSFECKPIELEYVNDEFMKSIFDRYEC